MYASKANTDRKATHHAAACEHATGPEALERGRGHRELRAERDAGERRGRHAAPGAALRAWGTAALLLAALAALPSPALAQTVTLVSNSGQGTNNFTSSSRNRAQRFTTGTNAAGYWLDGIAFRGVRHNVSFTARVFTVNAQGNRDQEVAALSRTGGFDTTNVAFDAPDNTRLRANTTYTVVVDPSGSRSFGATNSNNQDAGAAAGWSIADGSEQVVSGSWSSAGNKSLKIVVTGENAVNTAATGAPTISGSGRVGQTLTATTSGISDPDGVPSTFTYRWIRVDGTTETDVGTDSATYMPVAADLGNRIKVEVSFNDDAGFAEARTSAAVAIHAAMPPATCPAFSVPAGREQVWTGTVTVAASPVLTGGVPIAYGFGAGPYGSVSDTDFDLGATTYTVDGASVNKITPVGQLTLSLDQTLSAVARARLRLHVCGETYALSDSNYSSSAHNYRWPTAGLDWSGLVGSTRQLYLTAQDVPPTIESATVDSWWVTLKFSEELDESQTVSANRFRVYTGDAATENQLEGGQVRPVGRTVTLRTRYRLASRIEVSYSQPRSGGLQDPNGNRVRSFTRHRGTVLTNNQSPTLLQATLNGNKLNLTYNWGLNTSGDPPDAGAFSVRHPDGSAVAVTAVRVAGVGVTLTLASAAAYREYGWTVSYDASRTTRPLRVGSSGNVRSFQGIEPVNHTPATHGPLLKSAVWHDDWIRLTYDQSVTAVAPPTSAYTVTANGAVLAVASTSVFYNLVVVNLSSAVPSSVPSCGLRVTYDPPTSNAVTGRHSEVAAPALDFVEVRRLESDGTGAPCEARPASEGPVPVEARVWQTGTSVSVTYDQPISQGGLPTILVIKVNGSPIIFAGTATVQGDPRTWELHLLSTPIRQGNTVTISYSRDPSRPDHQKIQDTDGNEAPSFTDFPVINDSNAAGGPALVSAVVPTSGDSVVLTYHTALDESAAARPPANAFTVEVTTRHKDISGGPTTTVSVGAVTVSGSTVSLSNLSTAIRGDTTEVTRTVRVSYNSQGLGAKALQSTGGVDASPFGDLTATNNSTLVPSSPGVGPGPIHAAGRTDGTTIVIRFDEDMDIAAAAGTAAWRVTGSGVNRTFGNIFFVGTSSIGIFSISPAIRQGEPVTVSYTKPTSGRVLQDTSGNDADSFTDFPVVNSSTVRGLSVANAEGTEGTDSAITFTVTLLPAAATQVTVQYATSDGTAEEGSDYTETSGTLTFAAGVTSQTVDVPIIDDSVEDDGETFTFTLSNAVGASIVDATATGTIHNTEESPTPHVTGVELVADASGDRAWTPGETIEARLTFSEAVTVSGGSPWLEVAIDGFAHNGFLGYTSGSGSETLTFSMDVPAGAQPFTGLAVVANSLVADGSIVSGAGVAAVLAHDGTEPTAPPETDETPGGTTNAFKVTLKGVPAEHDGSTPVVFEVEFNKEPEGYSYVTMRDATLVIRQGDQSLNATKARRLNRPHNDRWEVTITPVSKADLQVSIGPFSTCTETGAVCAANDEVLANDASKTIQGPPGLSVADATAEEGPNVSVDFAVTLSRASTSTVTVDYATSDGTAQAGSDYTETSGTLTFAAGVTEQTVAVPVLDDSHDEESETFTLTLSNPSGGNAYLADATATGTIENNDPMPKAWLTRFGRTVASQAVDAIGGRMEGTRDSHVTVGGMQLNRNGQLVDPDETLTLAEQFEAMDPGADSAVQSMSAREALLGSSFSLSAGGEGGTPAVTGWGRVATGGFEADVDGTRLDGSVTSAFLGADVGRDRWLAGLAVSFSNGDGDYELMEGDDSGSVESSLTTVYPYAKVGLTEKVDVWGLAGMGSGELTLTQDANANRASEAVYETDISMRMGAVGMRGQVVSPEASGGLGVAIKSDAFWVRTESEAVTNAHGNLAAAEGRCKPCPAPRRGGAVLRGRSRHPHPERGGGCAIRRRRRRDGHRHRARRSPAIPRRWHHHRGRGPHPRRARGERVRGVGRLRLHPGPTGRIRARALSHPLTHLGRGRERRREALGRPPRCTGTRSRRVRGRGPHGRGSGLRHRCSVRTRPSDTVRGLLGRRGRNPHPADRDEVAAV